MNKIWLALVLWPTLALGAPAHEHGIVKLDIAIDSQSLTIRLDAPLESLLGFEHRPKTAAERQAADAVLKRINDPASLFGPEAAALCTPGPVTIHGDVLSSEPARPGTPASDHADFDASFEFSCKQIGRLGAIEVRLFDAFKRIRRIDVQIAGPQGQRKLTLRQGQQVLQIRR